MLGGWLVESSLLEPLAFVQPNLKSQVWGVALTQRFDAALVFAFDAAPWSCSQPPKAGALEQGSSVCRFNPWWTSFRST